MERTPILGPRPEYEALILSIANQNPRWGAKRIQGALAQLYISLCTQTILNVLKRNGIHPEPTREGNDSWSQFIKCHRDVLVATDFFSHEVLTLKRLITYYVLFFIELGARQVKIAGITNRPNELWMKQMARNLTMDGNPLFENKKYLIHDRDTKYCNSFCKILNQSGIKTIKLPAMSPNLNAYTERWVRSIKSECLQHFILVSIGSLEKALNQYVTHYNLERTHQGINNCIPHARMTATNSNPHSEIRCNERLGGLLNYYYRAV